MVHATYEWLWTTIWVAISVIFTMPVAVIVLWIMLGRKKDELKARLAYLTFKEVVSDYFFQLTLMPKIFHVRRVGEYEGEYESLRICFCNCHRAWKVTEILLDDNEMVARNWNNFVREHNKYMSGVNNFNELEMICESLLRECFIFRR